MYKKPKYKRGSIKAPSQIEGEFLETKIERMIKNGEEIGEEVNLIYTEKKDGVVAAYNPKADRFDIALDAVDKVTASYEAKSQAKGKMEIVKDEPTQGTENGDEPTSKQS
jgi:hypothetical protein